MDTYFISKANLTLNGTEIETESLILPHLVTIFVISGKVAEHMPKYHQCL